MIEAVDISPAEVGHLKAEPVFFPEKEDAELGVGRLANYCAGAIGERIALGEKDIVNRFASRSGDWIAELLDTEHCSDLDLFCVRSVLASEDCEPELIKELQLAEWLLRRSLPLIDMGELETLFTELGGVRMMGVHNLIH